MRRAAATAALILGGVLSPFLAVPAFGQEGIFLGLTKGIETVVWKGSELYLQLYQWDKDWLDIIAITGEESDYEQYVNRANFALLMNQIFGLLSAFSVGGTFVYLYRLLS